MPFIGTRRRRKTMGRPALRYVYPISNVVSFTFIARHHVAWLRRRIPIEVADEPSLDRSGLWAELDHGIPTLLHPILYVLMGDKTSMYWERIHRLELLRSLGGKLGGFDVADSDQLSEKAVDVLNQIDLVVVPSTWAAQAYRDSDVQTPVEVVPHGLSDAFVASNPVSNLAQGEKGRVRDLVASKIGVSSGFLAMLDEVYRHADKAADVIAALDADRISVHAAYQEILRRLRLKVQIPGLRLGHFFAGKHYLIRDIMARIPPHDVYVEPFGGFASVLLNKPPSKVEVYNDINKDVVNFLVCLRDRPLDFISRLYGL